MYGQLLEDADAEECVYPPSAVPAGTPSDPCDFTCLVGFRPSPTDLPTHCICDEEQGYSLCGDRCRPFHQCDSEGLRSQSVASVDIRKRGDGVISAPRRRMMCPRGKTPCALYGQQRKSIKLQWECVDILKDEESCEYPVQFIAMLKEDTLIYKLVFRWRMRKSAG